MRLRLGQSSTTQLWILVALSTVSWSFGPICIRFALQHDVPPALIASGRMVVGALFFTPYVWRKYAGDIQAMPARSRWLAIFAGAMFGFNITLNAASLEHISVIIGQALIATIPIWVAILEVAILKVKLKGSVWLGVFVALAGAMLISWATSGEAPPLEGGNPSLGIIMALISACSASLYIIIGRKVRGSVSFVPYIWLVYTSGAVTTLLIIASSRTPVLGYEWQGYLWVLLLAVLAQIIGHGVLNFVLRYLSPTTLTVTAQTVPVLSALWALLILSETPTMTQVAGSIVLVLGVGIVLGAQNRAKIRSS
ncbi:MAG: DMT family transporter [Chloroflexota bacterium]|nr:DMT family transporter [Chloroflexota bacterium]MDE2949517.1 DMT family transporter [Chloroflexota bacterium]